MLRKTGLDERDMTTNRYVLHLYSLRKFFLSQMKLEVPVVIPEALAGHEEGLDESYRRFTPDEVAEYYRKAEPRLTILSAPADLSGLHDDITKLKEENRNTTDMLSKLMVNYNLLKDEYEKIKNKK